MDHSYIDVIAFRCINDSYELYNQ